MQSLEELDIDLLLEAIFRKYGYDFRSYGRASLRRRIQLTADEFGIDDALDLMRAVTRYRKVFDRFVTNMSVTVTEMFRDPGFYLAVRELMVPRLETYPYINVWHAGCATGEEVYSLAIVLAESGLLERTRFYATDFNTRSLDTAREGVYPLYSMQQYTRNYLAAGGTGQFADYYCAKYNSAIMARHLGAKMVFAKHNLASDGVFTEANIVLCRNVLIYFKPELQQRVLSLFTTALTPLGFLALGLGESIARTTVADRFSTVSNPFRIYQLND